MNHENGIEVSGEFSPFLRACIGISIVALAFTPALYVLLRYG